jgi:protein involved in polysaccharide export with SLBB domain
MMRGSAASRFSLYALLAGAGLALLGCGMFASEEAPPASPPPPAAAAPGAAHPPAPGGPSAAALAAEYLLGPGDEIQVTVYQQPDLTGKFTVDGNGNLSLPLIGAIKASGRPVAPVQAEITEKLNAGYLVNPKVTLQVLTYRPFYILGQVNKPGSYAYVVGLTVRQAVAIAGGYTARAQKTAAKITHQGQGKEPAVEHLPDDPVLPGDTIEIERRSF